jgi:alpha-amylase/alpha-mannosidase (GH57 family)
MHQPYYEDLATGEHILPWVRLHAIKDYWGMVAMLEEFPRVRMTFNLVPSLLVQIQAFAEDRARDHHLRIGLKPADTLDGSERAFLVANGFHAPYERMIRPFPRYAELHARRQRPESFAADDLRDLQVLHKLAWMDPDRMATDPQLAALTARQRGYSEDDKQVLREVELELLNAVIPAYRAAAARGQIELSTSPFYHPILPLLCDTDVHLVAQPQSVLPRRLFARPADAEAQIGRAFALHELLFGSRPDGVWPSEGSLSDEVIRLLAAAGCRWTATDEEILARSLGHRPDADALCRPYLAGDDAAVAILFRDHGLSDLIGFTYQSWAAEAAAEDFVARVRDAGQRALSARAPGSSAEVPTVTVVLDGENAWEHYAGGGRPFLRALYRRLAVARDIETVTMGEAALSAARRLERVFPGSWINGDFYIWAGHADDHRAWQQLAAARDAYEHHHGGVDAEPRARAWEELLIAEGSDWFWWYGDDHSSDHDHEFDELFRRHLRNVYRNLDLPAPAELHTSNITTRPLGDGLLEFPLIGPPAAGGTPAAFMDQLGAVDIPLVGESGAMHRVAASMADYLRVAADRRALHVWLAGPGLVRGIAAGQLAVTLVVDGRAESVRLWPGPSGGSAGALYARVPFLMLGLQAGDRARLFLLIADAGGHAVERLPHHHPFEIEVPGRLWSARRWLI